MIRCVFFDAGGTLIEPTPSVGAIYARAGAPHGLEASPATLEVAFREAWLRSMSRRYRMGNNEESTRTFWRGIVHEVFDRVAFTGDREACFLALYRAFEEPRAWRVFDDVVPTLDELASRGLRVGVISNWDRRLAQLLDRLGLGTRFDPVLVSAVEGIEKPNREIFVRACERARVQPKEAAYIGDSESLDIAPALDVGMRAFLIDRHRAQDFPQALTRLDELLARL